MRQRELLQLVMWTIENLCQSYYQGSLAWYLEIKGYVSAKLAESLAKKGIQLIAKPKKNMKKKVITAFEQAALRKKSIIETIYYQLKNISQIEHTRHRSVKNFAVNLVAGLIAYTEQEKKPSIDVTLMNQLPSSCMIS